MILGHTGWFITSNIGDGIEKLTHIGDIARIEIVGFDSWLIFYSQSHQVPD
jgi:hypothetical protein